MLNTLVKLEQQKEEYVKIQKETDLFISENYQPESKFAIDLVNRNIKKNTEALTQIKDEFFKKAHTTKANITKYQSGNKEFVATPEKIAKGERALDIIARSGGKLSPESIMLLLDDVVDPRQMQIISDLLPCTECEERMDMLKENVKVYTDVLDKIDSVVEDFNSFADNPHRSSSYTLTNDIIRLQEKTEEFKLKYEIATGKRAPEVKHQDVKEFYNDYKEEQQQQAKDIEGKQEPNTDLAENNASKDGLNI